MGRRFNRDKCFAKWKKLNAEDKAKIKIHVPAYVASTPDMQYRKHPLTYLNNKSWNDEIITNSEQGEDLLDDF